MQQNKQIIALAQQLGILIRENDITRDYLKLSADIKNDHNAQLLLSRLVEMGKMLSEQAERGDGFTAEENAESHLIKEELLHDEKVRPFLAAQKKYLGMMELVKKALWNPER